MEKTKMWISKFWHEIAPPEWKKKEKKSKRKKRKKATNTSKCRDALHHIPKAFDFTKQRFSMCQCSELHRPSKQKLNKDIRSFIVTASITHDILRKPVPYIQGCQTQSDKIRAHHDLLKRRKSQVISVQLQLRFHRTVKISLYISVYLCKRVL